MPEYGIDVDAGQIVHWLMDDLAAGKQSRLDIRATREYAAEPVADPEQAGLGEDEEAAVLTTVGRLEVRPAGGEPAWVMRLRVDDVLGPHLPDDESVPEDPEEIDIEAFFENFVVPDRGTFYASVEVETPEAKQALDRLLAEMITDRHRR